MGTTILLGQQIGSGKKEEGGRTVGTAIVMFAAIAVVMSIIMVVFAPSISQIMNAPEEAFQKTVDYIRICGGGMLVIVAYNLIGCITAVERYLTVWAILRHRLSQSRLHVFLTLREI